MVVNIKLTEKLADIYNRLATDRMAYLTRARQCSTYTIPSLIPEEGTNSSSTFKNTNQSVGADGINNLAAKIALVLMPPNTPSFRFDVNRALLKQQVEANGADLTEVESNLQQGLSFIENDVLKSIEASNDRTVLGEALKHLLVAGNVLLLDDPEAGLKYYPLSRYVQKRSYTGEVTQIVTVEDISYSVLPDNIKALIQATQTEPVEQLIDKPIKLYTGVIRYSEDGKNYQWVVVQEIAGQLLTENASSYPIDIQPFMSLRYTRLDGEDYGRGLIEDYLGDLAFLDDVSKALKDSALAASKVLFFVKPGSVIKVDQIAKKKTGDFVNGSKDDIGVLQLDKYYDLRTASEEKEKVEKRLYKVFLMFSGVQRDAERVTQEEIKAMMSELQEGLGNSYALMNKEFQKPYIQLKLHYLKKNYSKQGATMPDVMKNPDISLIITTGLEALGRSSELQKLGVWLDVMTKYAVQAQAIGLNMTEVGKKVALNLGLNIDGLMKDPTEVQTENQNAQATQLGAAIAPAVVNNVGKAQIENLKAQQQQQQEGVSNTNG